MLVLAGTAWVQTQRLETCQAKAEANKLVIQGLGNQITAQNSAVTEWENAAKTAKAKGATAVAKARKESMGLQGEVARLDALLKQKPGAAKACSDGVVEARKGLSP